MSITQQQLITQILQLNRENACLKSELLKYKTICCYYEKLCNYGNNTDELEKKCALNKKILAIKALISQTIQLTILDCNNDFNIDDNNINIIPAQNPDESNKTTSVSKDVTDNIISVFDNNEITDDLNANLNINFEMITKEEMNSFNHLEDNDEVNCSDSEQNNATDIEVGPNESFGECKVCGDIAKGIRYGVECCAGCHRFFYESLKTKRVGNCVGDGNCLIARETRTKCRYCRYNKCIAVGMCKKSVILETDDISVTDNEKLLHVNECKVCGDNALGNYNGAVCCSGCKSFFEKSVLNRRQYSCVADQNCFISPVTRNACRYCRYKKCIAVGMCADLVEQRLGNKSLIYWQNKQQLSHINTAVNTSNVMSNNSNESEIITDLNGDNNNKTIPSDKSYYDMNATNQSSNTEPKQIINSDTIKITNNVGFEMITKNELNSFHYLEDNHDLSQTAITCEEDLIENIKACDTNIMMDSVIEEQNVIKNFDYISNKLILPLNQNIASKSNSINSNHNKNENNNYIINKNKRRIKKSIGECKVCGDIAREIRYGVECCGGCHRFFYALLKTKRVGNCVGDGNCLITRETRNQCRHCRYNKCIAVGMCVQTVRSSTVANMSELSPQVIEHKYVCNWKDCQYSTPLRYRLIIHKKRHLKTKSYRCVSESVFVDKWDLNAQCTQHSDLNICCPLFETTQSLERCQTNVLSNDKPFDCNHCLKQFHTKTILAQHLRRSHCDSKTFKCNHCDYNASNKTHLDIHNRRVHLMERNYRCDVDGCEAKRFFAKNDLLTHQMCVHSDERQFVCDWPECGAAFKLNSHLLSHIQRHTRDNKLRKTFVTETHCNYSKTTRNHVSNETKMICYVCEFEFMTKTQLISHNKEHHSKPPFNCEKLINGEVCGRVYTHLKDLNGHNKRVHCNECGKLYKCKIN